jgi:SAM-dependent methyltransferase
MDLYRPRPIEPSTGHPLDRRDSSEQAAARLLAGEVLRLTDSYGFGADILAALHDRLRPPPADAGYPARRAFQRAWRDAALRLLVPIVRHRVALTGAEPIGFLAELYPERADFWLPLPEVQELHGAWRRYQDGVHLAVLGQRLHPFFGTYAPTRTEHLELFATWLRQHDGRRERAVDVGTGCGVLALMLARSGVSQVVGTDINPNAVESLRREVARRPTAAITARCCDLLGDDPTPADLIVFNPPWMHGPIEGLLDSALYFGDGLFERFFEQAIERLAPGGRIVLVFSNVLSLVQPGVPHPIEAELSRGRLRLVEKHTRRIKPPVDAHGRRRRTRERVEVWVLGASSV